MLVELGVLDIQDGLLHLFWDPLQGDKDPILRREGGEGLVVTSVHQTRFAGLEDLQPFERGEVLLRIGDDGLGCRRRAQTEAKNQQEDEERHSGWRVQQTHAHGSNLITRARSNYLEFHRRPWQCPILPGRCRRNLFRPVRRLW